MNKMFGNMRFLVHFEKRKQNMIRYKNEYPIKNKINKTRSQIKRTNVNYHPFTLRC